FRIGPYPQYNWPSQFDVRCRVVCPRGGRDNRAAKESMSAMTLMRILTLALACNFLFADDPSDDLLAATRKGDLAAVKALLDRGVSVNSKSPYGSTPLFFPCDRGHVEIVKLLIDRGADVNVE